MSVSRTHSSRTLRLDRKFLGYPKQICLDEIGRSIASHKQQRVLTSRWFFISTQGNPVELWKKKAFQDVFFASAGGGTHEHALFTILTFSFKICTPHRTSDFLSNTRNATSHFTCSTLQSLGRNREFLSKYSKEKISALRKISYLRLGRVASTPIEILNG